MECQGQVLTLFIRDYIDQRKLGWEHFEKGELSQYMRNSDFKETHHHTNCFLWDSPCSINCLFPTIPSVSLCALYKEYYVLITFVGHLVFKDLLNAWLCDKSIYMLSLNFLFYKIGLAMLISFREYHSEIKVLIIGDTCTESFQSSPEV